MLHKSLAGGAICLFLLDCWLCRVGAKAISRVARVRPLFSRLAQNAFWGGIDYSRLASQSAVD